MYSPKRNSPRRWPTILPLVALCLLQSFWLYHTYQLAYRQFIADVREAFDEASQKEQTYRIPLNEIVSPGNLTIKSCENEEIIIIRNCPEADTIVYDNVYGQSLETFIDKAFHELRERIVPLNIHCLADLFAGALHERSIPLSFTIDHLDTTSGKIIETTVLPGEEKTAPPTTYIIEASVSDTESLRVHLHFPPTAILGRMTGAITLSAGLLLIIIGCVSVRLYFARHRKEMKTPAANTEHQPARPHAFVVGQYTFNAEKNELREGSTTIHLNKKENAILEALCLENGNVVERTTLLEQHWDGSGVIYSRSLDTYITRLRKYLKDDPTIQIVTIKGVGYKLVQTDQTSHT